MTTTSLPIDRALAELADAAEYLRGAHMQHVVADAVRAAVLVGQSPWLTRKDAALHARCSTTEIDRAVKRGVLVAHRRGGTSLFRRDDIDAAIVGGRWAL